MKTKPAFEKGQGKVGAGRPVHPVVAGLAAALEVSENLRTTQRLIVEARHACERAAQLREQSRAIRVVVLHDLSDTAKKK